VVDLQRRVLDAEALVEQLLQLAPASVAVVPRGDEHVRRERDEAGRDLPHVEVVHLGDPGRGRQRAALAVLERVTPAQ